MIDIGPIPFYYGWKFTIIIIYISQSVEGNCETQISWLWGGPMNIQGAGGYLFMFVQQVV